MAISGGQTTTCRAKVLCATLDLPAKAKVLQFNGKFGCTVCKQEGKVVRVGKGRTCVYQYLEHTSLWTHRECYELGRVALVQDEVYMYMFTDKTYMQFYSCTAAVWSKRALSPPHTSLL